MHFGRHRAGGARFLPGQTEVANFHRMGGIAEIVDLRHPPRPPIRRAGDQEGNAGVAFPPVLVGILQSSDAASSSTGFAGSATFQISCASLPKVRSM